MRLKLGHVTVGADGDAHALADFYRDVIGLAPAVTPGAKDVDPSSYKWLKLGDTSFHIVERDTSLHKRLGVSIDPMAPHIAIELDTVEEIQAMAERLKKAGVKWMDWSPHGLPGKHQIFMVDPGGNLIEFILA